MLALRASPVSGCIIGHLPYTCASPSSSLGSFASSHPSLRASLAMCASARTCHHACSSSEDCLSNSPSDTPKLLSCAPPVRLEIRLAPGFGGRRLLRHCSHPCSPVHCFAVQPAQLIRVLYRDLTTRSPGDNLPWPCHSVLVCSVEGPATSLACATGVRTAIHAHTVSVGLVGLAGEGRKGQKPISMPSAQAPSKSFQFHW